MHCPWCSATLVEAENGELKCTAVGALFSRHVSDCFRLLKDEGPKPTEPWRHDYGAFFCPLCGMQMNLGVCPNCRAAIPGAIAYQILELNPHVGA